MPSAIAHGLFGAALASVLPRQRRAKWVIALLAFLAAAPDLDVVAFRLGIPYEHPLGHRGITHSLFFAACVALASIPFWRRALASNAGMASLLTFVAVASHGVLDTFTDAGRGIGLFMPFDDGRYFAPWRPILTSPLSVSRFLSERGLAILQNEACWVGVPTLAFVATLSAARSILRAKRDAD